MSLSCSCQEWDGEGVAVYSPEDFQKFDLKRRKRCCSCGKLIAIGSDTLEFKRVRGPLSDVEERIYGDDAEISLASKWMCDGCGEIYLNLDALDFCIDIAENMEDLLKEYHEMTGFKAAERRQ